MQSQELRQAYCPPENEPFTPMRELVSRKLMNMLDRHLNMPAVEPVEVGE